MLQVDKTPVALRAGCPLEIQLVSNLRTGCGIVSALLRTGLLMLAVLMPTQGVAMFAQMSDEELVRRSDLVVVGEWIGQSRVQLAAGGGPLELGAVTITEVLKGVPGQTLALVATVAGDAPRSSSDMAYRRGDRGLWLLRLRQGSTGIYLADHPQRFIPDAGGAARIEALRKIMARR